MPTIVKRVLPAVSGVVDNALANSQYEFAPFDGTMEIGIMAGAPGCQCAIFSGPDVLSEPGSTLPSTPTGTAATPVEGMPKYPDDYHWEDEVAHGDRLKITITNTNTTGVAVPVNIVLRLTPA
jgi:hypothetical protein